MHLPLDSPDLQPLFTYTDNWRAALAVGTLLEASCLQTDADSLAKGVAQGTPVVRWYEATVKELDVGEFVVLVHCILPSNVLVVLLLSMPLCDRCVAHRACSVTVLYISCDQPCSVQL
jgi:hypothetical protein